MREPEKLQEALDLIAKGIVQPTKIAAGIGVPYRTYRSWMVRSNRGDEKFLIEIDGEVMQWAKAITLHTRLAMFELRGLVTQYSIFGDEEISYKDGQVVWALDPVAAALPEEDREWMGYRKDALLEIDGALQPVKMKKRAPIALQLRLLEATFKDMRPSSVQEVNLNGQVAVGIGFAKPVDYSRPLTIPPPPVEPLQVEILPDAVLEDMLALPEQVPSENLVEIEVPSTEPSYAAAADAVAEPVPAPVAVAPSAPSPVAIDETPKRQPRTALEADLYAKLEAARAKPKGQPNG
jgi:hypothetical protein